MLKYFPIGLTVSKLTVRDRYETIQRGTFVI